MNDKTKRFQEKVLARESRKVSAQMNIGLLMEFDLLIDSDKLGTVKNVNSGLSSAKKAFGILHPAMREGISKFNDKNPTTKVKDIILHPRTMNGNDGDYHEPCIIALFQNEIDWDERIKLCFSGPNCLSKIVKNVISERSKRAEELVKKHNPISSTYKPCCILHKSKSAPKGTTPELVENKLESASLISFCEKYGAIGDLHVLLDQDELYFGPISNDPAIKDVPSKPEKDPMTLLVEFCFKDNSGWVVKGYDMQDKRRVKKTTTMSLDDALVSSSELKALIRTKKLTSLGQLAHHVIEIRYCNILKSIHTEGRKKILSAIQITSIRKARTNEIEHYTKSS